MSTPEQPGKPRQLTGRLRIIAAAAEVMGERGLGRATTKEIARAAGCSEALLYKHFRDKQDLFLAVLHEWMPGFLDVLEKLPEQVGTGSVRGHLEALARVAVPFFERVMPMASSLFSERELLEKNAETLRARGAGPHKGNERVADYLRAEQRLGRIGKAIDPEAAAALLLGACWQRAFFTVFMGEDVHSQPVEPWAENVTRTLFGGLRTR